MASAACIVVFLLAFIDVDTAGMWKVAGDKLTHVFSFIGWDITEVATIEGNDLDGVRVMFIVWLGHQGGIECGAGKVFDSSAKIDTCDGGVIDVGIEVGPMPVVDEFGQRS